MSIPGSQDGQVRRELWPLLGVLQLPPTSLPCHTRLDARSGSASWALPRLPPPHLLKEAFCEPSAPRTWHMVQAMVTLCRGQVALRRGRSLRAHCPHWVPGLLSHLTLPPDHPHHQSPCWTPSFHPLSSLVGGGGCARRKTFWTAAPCCAHGGHRGPSTWAPSSWFLLLPEPTP